MPFPNPEDEALRLAHPPPTGSEEAPPGEALQHLCAIATAIMRAPVPLASLLDENDRTFAAKIGLDLEAAGMAEPVPGDGSAAQDDLIARLGSVAATVLLLHRLRLELEDQIAVSNVREQDLWDAAHCDMLTGLANLKQFREFATSILDRQSETRGCALILLDLDHFKLVNDQWGHAQGDAYLRQVAEQVSMSVRKQDLVARIGGDEFAILLTDIDGQEAPRRYAERIMLNLQSIAEATGNPDLGRASLGIALAPLHAQDLDELYKCADSALYTAKSTGRNAARLYIPRLDRRQPNPANRARAFRMALKAGEFIPYYQPKFDLQSLTLTGFEALARWNTKDLGVLAPIDFQALFEDKELAPLLTWSMLDQMAGHLIAWRQSGVACGSLAINAAAPDFLNENFAAQFLKFIADRNLLPRDFVMEVTEQIMLDDMDTRTYDVLKALQDAGIKIALDDFGIGYAGLKHLKHWPVNQVKIERLFIRDFPQDQRDSAIVESIIKMANAIGLGVTAEGIETPEQLQLLTDLRCETGQGYLFARPMPAADVPEYVKNHAQWH